MNSSILVRIFFFVSILLGCVAGEGLAQQSQFFALSNVKARPLAMGGAFTSVEDDLPGIGFNPAAFFLYENRKSKRITFFLNPVAPIVGGLENSDLYAGQGSKVDDVLLALGLLLKSVTVSISSFDFGVVLSERTLSLPAGFQNEQFFNTSGLRQNHTHTFIGSLKLARQISLGAALSAISGSKSHEIGQRHTGIGFSYGVLLSPEKGLNIGVSFVNLPDSLKRTKQPFERFVDESVNVGVSYRFFDTTLLSIDVRNLGEETRTAVREIHFGFEQVLFSHVAVRTGYFRGDNEADVFSFGVGVFDGNSLFAGENDFSHRNFLVNYAYVYEDTIIKNHTHFLSVFFRI